MEQVGYGDTQTITRQNNTTAYSAGQVIGGSGGATLRFAKMGRYAFETMIMSSRLLLSDSSVPSGMGNMRLHLYNAAPPSALADAAAWDLPSGDRAAYRGYIDMGTPVDVGSSLFVQLNQIFHQVKLDLSADLWAYLQTIAGYTPAALSTLRVSLRAMAL